MYRIEVPLSHPSLNSWLAGASHWKRSSRKKQDEHDLSAYILYSKIPRRLPIPFTLSVTVFRPRPYDVDNVVISAKYFLDALKVLGHIENDSIEFCPTLILNSCKGKEPKVVYLIEPHL